MDSSRLSEPDNSVVTHEASSPVRLLEAGLSYLGQERYVEGFAMLELARERLSLDQTHLAMGLDACMQSQAAYTRAHEALLQASRYFTQADNERQAQITAIRDMLLTLTKETGNMTRVPERGQALPSSSLYYLSPGQDGGRPATTIDHAPIPAYGLSITCFGRFEVRRAGKPIVLCSSRNGQTILRYLVTRPGRSATIDTLMGLLWPDDEAEVAQRKLHIAVSALRRSLSQGCMAEAGWVYISCKNRVYSLNMAAGIQIDVDDFLHYYQKGRQTGDERITCYEKACCLYTGPFLAEDMYADWSFLQREQLTQIYRSMCRVLAHHYLQVKQYEVAARWAAAILKENHCDEAAHRHLMQVYAAQGYRSEAVQQYHQCERILREELGVSPLPETTQLLQTLLKNESIS